MKKNIKKEIWLFISGFGIMFAVFSWLQESEIVSHELGWVKGLLALISGFFYICFSEVLYRISNTIMLIIDKSKVSHII